LSHFCTRSTARSVMVYSWAAAIALGMQLDPGALVPLYKQALAEREKQFGADHPKVARSASDLGLYLRNIGERDAAVAYLKRAFEIDAKTLDPSDKLLAEDLENLASVAPPEAALQLHQKAAECSDPAISARNWGKVGDLSAAQADRTAAEKAYRNALAKEEAASGSHDARVAVRLNDLAQVLEPKMAEPVLRRALAIERKALGTQDPATGITMNNLANALLGSGKLAEAEAIARRSLQVLESTLGLNHPRVATIHSNLAAILREKPDLAGARKHYARALAIDEAAYGPAHPEVAVDLQNLAEVFDAMGNKQEAKRLSDRAAAIGGR
jgi:tetratricopeptide (TPR) repeat protein